MSLAVQVRHVLPGGRVVVVARGECDLPGAAALRAQLDRHVAAGHAHLVADLTGITFIDSTGLGALVGVRKQLAARGGDLHLVVGEGSVHRLLRISALARLFTLHPTLDDALAAC